MHSLVHTAAAYKEAARPHKVAGRARKQELGHTQVLVQGWVPPAEAPAEGTPEG